MEGLGFCFRVWDLRLRFAGLGFRVEGPGVTPQAQNCPKYVQFVGFRVGCRYYV